MKQDHGDRKAGPKGGMDVWCSRCGQWLSWIEWWSWHRRAGRTDPSPHMNEAKRAPYLGGKP